MTDSGRLHVRAAVIGKMCDKSLYRLPNMHWIRAREPHQNSLSDPLREPKEGSWESEQVSGLFGCCAITSAGSARQP